MNHYERLKVSRDAPIEVIRAAYRALAAKHHPDRHTQPQSSHSDMAALNAAYEILGDAAARAAYDIELAESAEEVASSEAAPRKRGRWRSTMGLGGDSTVPPSQDEPDESRVDVNWRPSPPPAPDNPWMRRKRLLPVAAVVGVLAVVVCGWWMREAVRQMQAEQALSRHYGDKTHGQSPAARQAAITMTDEELLAEPPPMPGQAPLPQAVARAPQANHMLDGTPLSLRQETSLVDPLALPSTAQPGH